MVQAIDLRQKALYLLKRNPSLSRNQFEYHWFRVHAAVLKSIPIWAKLRSGYVQNHLIGAGIIGEWSFPYDGVAQVYVRPGTGGGPHFPDLPVFRERVVPDEEIFLDRARVVVIKTSEHIVIPGTSAVKVLIFHHRRAGTSHQDFVDHWSTIHAELVLSQKGFRDSLRGYRQNRPTAEPNRSLAGEIVPEDGSYDGASEYWFDTAEDARAAFGTDGYGTAIRRTAPSPFDTEREIACLVEPRVILPE